MKKCASCTKDLPEAALHCVFCGSKQPPAPAVQPGLAKTAFGYSASDQMKPQQPSPYQPPPRAGGSAPPPYGQQPVANAATMLAPPAQQPAYAQPTYVAPVAPQPPPHQAQAVWNPPAAAMAMGVQSARQMTPGPLPSVPHGHSQQMRVGAPVEPWKDSLRVVMLVWGVLTLLAFATPLSTEPSMLFQWDAILHGDGSDKLLPLIMAAVGFLAIVLSAIPMVPLPRGLLAAVLGLSGILVPLFMRGMPHWPILLMTAGTLTLVPGLLLRNEYVESLFARVLVTIGAICLLLPVLVPNGGQIPLVGIFKALIDNAGAAKLEPALELGMVVIGVLCLLAWMPGPSSAGAKVMAWLVILWPTLLVTVVSVLAAGHIVDTVKGSPAVATAWAAAAAYVALAGYGLATVLGKQLE